jgi:D-glycero-D-manno-heptose 1,7-bisphosphate phosphatase
MPQRLKALFLDRDGTLIEDKHYIRDPSAVVALPGVREALARVRAANILLFLLTNQSGVARGLLTLADVDAVNRRMIELFGLGDDLFAGICVAPEHPDERPRYRKPSPRYIRETLAMYRIGEGAAWMIGDSPVDWEAGINAGVSVAAIVTDPFVAKSPGRREELGVPAYPSLLAWVDAVLG